MKSAPLKSWYHCINDCPGNHSLTEVIYTCPNCGDLLEVQHDLDRLCNTPPRQWRELFAGPHSSGVWGKKEWVYPDLPAGQIVSMGEGRTPLVEAPRLAAYAGVDVVWVKLCGNSHTGSFKDLGMTVLVSVVNQMIAQGRTIKAVACASTGDTSAALATYCAAADIPALVLLPKHKISTAQLIQPIANGCLTFSLDTDFDGCMEIVRQLTESQEIYLANSMNSLRIEGQKTVSLELVEQLHWQVPDWIIVPGGNLGNVSAIGKGLLEMEAVGLIERLPRLVCAQAQRANPLFESYQSGFETHAPQTAKPTLASAIRIGNPVSIKKAIRVLQKLDGIVEQADEDELANAAALTDRNGLFVCPQTGVAVAAFLKLVDKGEIKPNHRVAVISTAHGLKFTDFKIGYHDRRLEGVEPRMANSCVELPADIDAVRELLNEKVSKRL